MLKECYLRGRNEALAHLKIAGIGETIARKAKGIAGQIGHGLHEGAQKIGPSMSDGWKRHAVSAVGQIGEGVSNASKQGGVPMPNDQPQTPMSRGALTAAPATAAPAAASPPIAAGAAKSKVLG